MKTITITNIKKFIGLILINAIIFSFQSKNHTQAITEKVGNEKVMINSAMYNDESYYHPENKKLSLYFNHLIKRN